MSLDDILRLVVTIAIYIVIFAVVGIAFHEVDKRFRAWVARSDRNPPPQSSEPFRAGAARRKKARR